MVARLVAALCALLMVSACGGWPSRPPKPTKPPVSTTSTVPPSTPTVTPTSTTVQPTTVQPTSTTQPPSTTTTTGTTTQPPRTGCSAVPSACGYPDATNTGYKPTGASLLPVHNGAYTITAPGVYDRLNINGCVVVRARDVTIRRSLLSGCDGWFALHLYPEAANFTVEDTEIDGKGLVRDSGFTEDGTGPVTIRRVYMRNVQDGLRVGENLLLEDSFVTDLSRCGICHNDTVQSAGAVNVTLRHNTLVNLAGTVQPEGGMNAVVRIATEQGPVTGFTVENNLLVGGNFAVQVRSQGHGAPQGVKVLNNRIGRGTTPDGQPYPRWGAPFDYPDVPVVFSGNVWDDDGSPAR